MLAVGDENFGAGDQPGPVFTGSRLCGQRPHIGPSMRLCEIHGPRPLPTDHFWEINLLKSFARMVSYCINCALSQKGTKAERHVCGSHHFLHS